MSFTIGEHCVTIAGSHDQRAGNRSASDGVDHGAGNRVRLLVCLQGLWGSLREACAAGCQKGDKQESLVRKGRKQADPPGAALDRGSVGSSQGSYSQTWYPVGRIEGDRSALI